MPKGGVTKKFLASGNFYDVSNDYGIGVLSIEEIMRALRLVIVSAALAVAYGQDIKTGPEVGQRVPDFSAIDQNGRNHTLTSIMGPKGAMLVFFRSADW
jgi:hypothetical protein